jgi:rare lipoprotein A (peptidoglycan hydrolase)
LVVNDRMAVHGRIVMDISEEACKELDFPSGGEAKVKIEALPASSVAEH